MFRVTFNPGPSQISAATHGDILDALSERIPEISHRSAAFSRMSEHTIAQLRTFFSVPDDYHVLYTSSATEAMQIVVSHLVTRRSFHFTCGSFSSLFQSVAQSNGKETLSSDVPWGQKNDVKSTAIADDVDLITLTYNETSTGVMCADADVSLLRTRYPETLLAVDVTSIAGMLRLPLSDADMWFFSVQKACGLPAGLGILILSPRALQRGLDLLASQKVTPGFLRLDHAYDRMASSFQTIMTPNVLGIFLLGRQMERWNRGGGLAVLEKQAREKMDMLSSFVDASDSFRFFVRDVVSRSLSVLCVETDREMLDRAHAACLQQGLLLGKGYGILRSSTFRIANFPATTRNDMRDLLDVLQTL